MKIRKSFVSNSSSSSFVCDVTGETAGGYDLCLSDIDWEECANGHTLSYGAIKDIDNKELDKFRDEARDWIQKVGREWRNARFGEEYVWNAEKGLKRWRFRQPVESDPDFYKEWMAMPESERQSYLSAEDCLPTKFCPICNFSVLSDSDIRRYILKKSGKTMKEWAAEVKNEFGDYDGFQDYLQS